MSFPPFPPWMSSLLARLALPVAALAALATLGIVPAVLVVAVGLALRARVVGAGRAAATGPAGPAGPASGRGAAPAPRSVGARARVLLGHVARALAVWAVALACLAAAAYAEDPTGADQGLAGLLTFFAIALPVVVVFGFVRGALALAAGDGAPAADARADAAPADR